MSHVVLIVVILLAFNNLSGVSLENNVFMSFMTKYDDVRGDIRKIDLRNNTCSTLKLWILQRHGIRYPDLHDIHAIRNLKQIRDSTLENHKNGRGSLTPEGLLKLQHWNFTVTDDSAMKLSEEGYDEIQKISKRFKEKFSALLGREYSEKDFYFQHTAKERTESSCRSYIDGLFGMNSYAKVNKVVIEKNKDFILMPRDERRRLRGNTNLLSSYINVPVRDQQEAPGKVFSGQPLPLTTSFEGYLRLELPPQGGACPKLARITETFRQSEGALRFPQTEEFQKVLRDISFRLGFEKILNINTVSAMYISCGFETAWSKDSNLGAWCAALDKEAMKVFEYNIDLALHAQAGYSNKVTETTNCGPVKDLWSRFEPTVVNATIENDQSVIVLVTHEISILGMHTALGLLKDDPPVNADNYRLQGNRKWRNSIIVPWAANIVAVLQKCHGTGYDVIILRNEKPFADFPGCPGGICSWSNFKKVIEPVARNCNFRENC